MASHHFATFVIEEHLFGINVLLVREINPSTSFTPVDRAPDFVRGLMNLRGQIVTVIDPAVRLGMERREITPRSRCIVLKTTQEVEEQEEGAQLAGESINDSVGLLVDSIGDMVTATNEEIEPPPANISEIDGRFMTGVMKLEDRLMLILKTGALLEAAK